MASQPVHGNPTETWTLYLRAEADALPWPWKGKGFNDLAAADVRRLPHGLDAFLRYSPTDGVVDSCHVVTDMPRETPRCRTLFSAFHDDAHLTVFLEAVRPDAPIPELAGEPREDLSLAILLGEPARGLYFGMNDEGEHIGCVQLWEQALQPDDLLDRWPWSLLQTSPGSGPSNTSGGLLHEGYRARLFDTGDSRVACWQINKRLLAPAGDEATVRLSAGRRCYATSELVSWGSPMVWSPRPDRMAVLRRVDRAEPPPLLPRLDRIDLLFDRLGDDHALRLAWSGAGAENGFERLERGPYADYMRRVAVSVNGIEEPSTLGAAKPVPIRLANGVNRIEILTPARPPAVLHLPQVSGRTLEPSSAVAKVRMPSKKALTQALAAWHESAEQQRQGPGVWGAKDAKVHCLCHCGVFWMLPYLWAWKYLEARPVYEERIRETAERMLGAQHADGWFPCHCSGDTSPELRPFMGGAFTHGSVGEALAQAGLWMGEPAWMEASRRAAEAYPLYRWEDNQNYAAFALWHLAELYEQDSDARWLERAVYYAENFVARDIGPGGAQDGHNFFTGYGNITLKGLARLLAVLPPSHRAHPGLRDRTFRFANQVLARQQPSGLFAGRNRRYVGYHHFVPGLFEVAFAVPEQRAALRPALAAMTATAVGWESGTDGHAMGPGMSLAAAGRWLAESRKA